MLRFLEVSAAVITILNFIVAVVGISSDFTAFDSFNGRVVSPTVGFFTFFLLEILCSLFVCMAVIGLHKRNEQMLMIYVLFFGIINVATSVFNYKLLLRGGPIVTPIELYSFIGFLFGAYLVDIVVIVSIAGGVDGKYRPPRQRMGILEYRSRSSNFRNEDRRSFIFVQGVEYFISVLYFAFVGHAI